MKLVNELQNVKRVSVFGMGKSGVAAVRLLKKCGLETHAINEGEVVTWKDKDGLSQVLETQFMHPQNSASEIFAQSDLIVISPGIPTTHEVLRAAVAKNVKVISEVELAYWFTRSVPVVAITGTNGKTTTTTMIFEALKLAGKKVFCGGNIGTPYCQMAEAMLAGELFDYAVIEVSSFQLETIDQFHPQIALMLNLTPNHSERYQGLDDYGAAKFRLLMNMNSQDELILGRESGEWWMHEASKHSVKKHLFSKSSLPVEFLSQFDFSRGVLVGGHNRANYFCAWKVLTILAIPDLRNLFQKFIETFKGVEHRLEFVGNFQGLKVYNDAKSTNGEATRTALAAFETSEPLYLVVGGKLRNETDKLLPDVLPFKAKIAKVFTIGMTTERLYEELKDEFAVEKMFDLKTMLKMAKEKKLQGNLVFSPAHPSFDQFKNYVDRGLQFKQLTREILS